MGPQQRAMETRARILAAALDCFSTRGYDATGVAEICARAGVSKGAFYHHFPGKQALFLALLEEWLAALDAQLSTVLEQTPSAPEAMVAMAGLMPSILATSEGHLPLFLEFWLQASRDRTVWEATIAPYRRYRAFFSRLIAAGIGEGALKPVQPEVGAAVIVSFAVGLLLQGLLDAEGLDWGTVAKDGLRLLVEGMNAG